MRAQAGDRHAFAVLVRRFQGPLTHFLGTRSASPEDTEELVQEAFLRAWKSLDAYDASRSFSTWLYTLAARLAISSHRRQRPKTSESQVLQAHADGETPSRIVSEREQGKNLWELARRILTPDQHAALWLRYGEDMDMRQIAEVLGKRESTVRVILFRARETLAPRVSPDPSQGVSGAQDGQGERDGSQAPDSASGYNPAQDLGWKPRTASDV